MPLVKMNILVVNVDIFVATLTLARDQGKGLQRCELRVKPGITFHALESAREREGMNPYIPSELPFRELESQWISKVLEGDSRS
jgi:hypothetical protein